MRGKKRSRTFSTATTLYGQDSHLFCPTQMSSEPSEYPERKIISYSFCDVHCTPAASRPSSPSTNTHHPSLPRPPSPAITASKCFWANCMTASSKVPGCSQTAGIPTEWASCNSGNDTAGGVTTDSDVCAGDGRTAGEATVVYVCEGREI